ncbi:MAG: HD domain-containing protein [Candidatus Helarchaeota archaeon]
MHFNEEEFKNIIDLIKTIGKLKKIKRKGWIRRNINDEIESVADHSYLLTILSMIIADKVGLNKEKLIKMSLIHDFPESLVGDITPFEKTIDEKYKLELQAMKKICSKLKNSEEYYSLWLEFEEGKSKEAKLIRQLDKLEMVFQALDYELRGTEPKKLNEFWDYTEQKLTNSFLINLFKMLKKLRTV